MSTFTQIVFLGCLVFSTLSLASISASLDTIASPPRAGITMLPEG